jgi:uncharacterized membrane protein required for colicin V production
MDYSFLAILILSGLAGAYQGLVRMAVGFISLIFTFFISTTYYNQIANIIKTKTPIYRMLKSSISSNMDKSITSIQGMDKLTQLNDNVVNTLIGMVHVPPVLRNFILKQTHVDITHINTKGLIDIMSTNSAEIFVKILGFIILFASIQFIFTIAETGLGAIFQLPILSEVNILGGFGLGALQGIITLFVICAAWSMLSGSSMYKEVFVDLNASKYAKWFYDNNQLLEYLVKYKL